MTTQTEITPANKAQLDALIELCLGDPKFHEAAGLLKLASDIISEKVHQDDEPECHCYEYMGDNPKCPKHGGDISDIHFSMEEILSDYQERNDLYTMGMGA